MSPTDLQPVPVTVELHVLYDGPEFGLPQHRLSITTFGSPMWLLLTALQRTASMILSSALDNPEYRARGGPLARGAKLLDLQLVQVHEGCAEPRFICTTAPGPDGQLPLIEDLAIQTVDKLVADLEMEAKGVVRNAAARRYLRSLPESLVRQRYTAMSNGVSIRVAEFGSATIADAPAVMGRLVQRRAKVVGVGFEPFSVRLKIDGRPLTVQASVAQVEAALAIRHGDVLVAMIEEGDRSRLIWLRAASAAVSPPSLAATVVALRTKWPETLRILAQ